ncbi:hypothetical protein LPJ56_000104 [Coemansia sp. RSA 2599]|nr:hypothetical protein LPJ75_001846 [Coemansia sp. RSA 2598]KAJ1829792.1 hypothetical protein LPJ56_000104 [Coemansia sp. RSA 2599]
MSATLLTSQLQADHRRTKQAIDKHRRAEDELRRVTQECHEAYEQARYIYEQEIQAAKNKMAQAEKKIAQSIWEAMMSKEHAMENATKELHLVRQKIMDNYPFLEELGIKIDMPRLQQLEQEIHLDDAASTR